MSAVRTAFVLTIALLPGALAAQIPLGFGKAVSGRLTVADQQFSDGSRQKMYAFVGNRGDTVTADLMSEDFDPLIILADASGNPLTRNDDGGENCNARLSWVLPAAANYRLYATSSSKAELGEYQIRIVRGHESPPADSTCRGFGRMSGVIQVGQSVSGTLTSDDRMFQGDSTFFQVYTLPVEANQTVTVDLESSEFDPFLLLIKGRDSEANRLAQNDDGGGNCNARIVYTAPDDHPLRVIANTASVPKRQTGRFTLRVSDGESPIEAKGADCRGRPNAPQAGAPAGRGGDVAGGGGPARAIQIGQAVTGTLSRNDSLYPDNTYFQLYQFTTTPGSDVTIDLSSDDFDPVLILRGGDLDESVINDDGGPGCSSRVSQTFSGRGPYSILVNTTSTPERQTGEYTLTLTAGRKTVQESGSSDCNQATRGTQSGERSRADLTERGAPPRAARNITIGEAVTGQITGSSEKHSDGTPVEWWQVDGRAGETVTVDMESDVFDAYLLLRGPGDTMESNDDDGGNCNPRITITFPQTGTYRIGANTVSPSALGAYSLSVTRGSRGHSSARCEQSRFH